MKNVILKSVNLWNIVLLIVILQIFTWQIDIVQNFVWESVILCIVIEQNDVSKNYFS
jgi:hypothetical protein